MVTFIPEWTKVSGRQIHLKRVLNTLDDVCVVRKPIRSSEWAPDLFIQHPEKGWLTIAVNDLPYSSLDPGQLFDSEERSAFEQILARFSKLDGIPSSTNSALGKIMVMWSCSQDESSVLSKLYLDQFGIRILSKEKFIQLGDMLIPRLLRELDKDGEQSLLGHFFPEAEIHAVCTTRRFFNRDNSAKLGRFFLDYQQEWASKLDLEPPQDQINTIKDFSVRLLNGVAGSGKTLIVINRALMLSEIFPSQRILVLIHNTPVVADIKDRLHRIRGGIPDNVEINTFFGWAHQQWRNVFRDWLNLPRTPQEVPDLIKHHRTQWPDLKPTEDQLLEELDFINECLIVTEAQYLDASRVGRGFALRPKERAQIWALHEAVTDSLKNGMLRMWSAVPREICLADDHQGLNKYHHILIDEAQFFAPAWFHLVKLATEAEGSLFLCADPNQGFMKSRLSWKSVGLDVTGRTKKLQKSYRTTRAILEAASQVLATFTEGDPDDFLEPDFTGMEQGNPPLLIYADTPQDAIDRVANEIAVIVDQGQLPLASLLVIYGDKIQKNLLYEQFCKRIGPTKIWWFNKKENKKEPPNGYGEDYLRLAYLDTATGLEASVVFLVGVESLFSESEMTGLSTDELAARQEECARKLYMAMTRAGQQLILVSTKRLPATIENLFDDSLGKSF